MPDYKITYEGNTYKLHSDVDLSPDDVMKATTSLLSSASSQKAAPSAPAVTASAGVEAFTPSFTGKPGPGGFAPASAYAPGKAAPIPAAAKASMRQANLGETLSSRFTELGIEPGAARALGVPGAVKQKEFEKKNLLEAKKKLTTLGPGMVQTTAQKKADKKKLAAVEKMLQEEHGVTPTGADTYSQIEGPGALNRDVGAGVGAAGKALGAAGGNPEAQGLSAALFDLLSGTPGGHDIATAQEQGVLQNALLGLMGFAEPESLLLGGGSALAAKPAGIAGQRLVAAAFGAPVAKEALEDYQRGEKGKAVGKLLAAAAPIAAHGAITKAMEGKAAAANRAVLPEVNRVFEEAKAKAPTAEVPLPEPLPTVTAKARPPFTLRRPEAQKPLSVEKPAEAAPAPPKAKTPQRKPSTKKPVETVTLPNGEEQFTFTPPKEEGEANASTKQGATAMGEQPVRTQGARGTGRQGVGSGKQGAEPAGTGTKAKGTAAEAVAAKPQEAVDTEAWRATFRKLRDEGKSVEEAGKAADSLHGELPSQPAPVKPHTSPDAFAEWIRKQPQDKTTFTSIESLYKAYQKEHGAVSREEFGQALQPLAVAENAKPEGLRLNRADNPTKPGVFTFKDSTGKDVHVSGLRPAAKSGTLKEVSPRTANTGEAETNLQGRSESMSSVPQDRTPAYQIAQQQPDRSISYKSVEGIPVPRPAGWEHDAFAVKEGKEWKVYDKSTGMPLPSFEGRIASTYESAIENFHKWTQTVDRRRWNKEVIPNYAAKHPLPGKAVEDTGSRATRTAVANPAEPPVKSVPQTPTERLRQSQIDATLDKKINYANDGILSRRQWVDKKLSEGSTPQEIQVPDTAKINKAQKELDFLRSKGEPSGNPNWPDTKRYNELKALIESKPTRSEYQIKHPGDSYHVVTKIEYDYAKSKESPPEPPKGGGSPAAKPAESEETTVSGPYTKTHHPFGSAIDMATDTWYAKGNANTVKISRTYAPSSNKGGGYIVEWEGHPYNKYGSMNVPSRHSLTFPTIEEALDYAKKASALKEGEPPRESPKTSTVTQEGTPQPSKPSEAASVPPAPKPAQAKASAKGTPIADSIKDMQAEAARIKSSLPMMERRARIGDASPTAVSAFKKRLRRLEYEIDTALNSPAYKEEQATTEAPPPKPSGGGKGQTRTGKLPPKSQRGFAAFGQPAKPGSPAAKTAQAVGEWSGKIGDEVNALFNPAGRSPEAGRAGRTIREESAKSARDFARVSHALHQMGREFERLPTDARIDFIDRMETGKRQADPKLQQSADQLREILDYHRQQVQDLGKGYLEDFNENYFPHIWKDPKAAAAGKPVSEAVEAARYLGKRPLTGPKTFLKQRTVPTLKEGIDRGLEPVTTNPVELTLLKAREMERFVAGQKIFQSLKDQGLVRFERGLIPEGDAPIHDSIAKVVERRETVKASGDPGAPEYIQRGQWVAPEPVARVLNNYLSAGAGGYELFKAPRAVNNLLNQAQLGISGFHFLFTAFDTAVSKAALGTKMIAEGQTLGQRAKGLGKVASASTPIIGTGQAWLEAMLRGNKLGKEYLNLSKTPSGETLSQDLQNLLAGGGRYKMDAAYRTGAVKAFQNALDNAKRFKAEGNLSGRIGQTAKAGALSLPAAFEAVSAPLMEGVVPRLKLGVFAQLAEFEYSKLASEAAKTGTEINPDAYKQAMARAWDSTENRLGQLTYDNLFWNRLLVDMGQISTRSLGWNLGSVREIPGGVLDFAQQGGRLKAKVAGKPSTGPIEMTPRMSYLIALPLVTAINGAVLQYLMTGKRPSEMKDYFFPKTGRRNKDGSEERLSMPSYMKDVYHFSHDPLGTAKGKAGPLLSVASEMMNNEDFYGKKLHNPDDPLVKRMQSDASYIAKQFTPISLRESPYGRERTTTEKAAQLLGVTKAPMYLSRTPKQEKDAATRRKFGEGMAARKENPGAIGGGSGKSPYPSSRTIYPRGR